MQVLVNHNKADSGHLPTLAYMLRKNGLTALSTSKHLELGQLIRYAKDSNCSAILMANDESLIHCVSGDKPTLDDWRGSRLNFSVPMIVINRLPHLNTVPYGEWLLQKDLDKLRSLHKRPVEFTFTKLLSIKRFKEVLNDLSKSICIYYDIETKTFPNRVDKEEGGRTLITCASWTGIFENGQLRTYMLPLIDFTHNHWDTQKEYEEAILFLKRANALPVPKAMHNGMYDATHSLIYNAPPLEYTLDTMALAHAEYAELPKDLSFVASYQLYDYIQWKGDSEAASKSRDIEKYWAYNAKDTWHGARVLVQQLRTAPAYAFRNYKEKFKLTYPTLYCNFEGFNIDLKKRSELRAVSEVQLNAARKRLHIKFANPNFNPGSWQQVEKYIYHVFGAVKPRIGKSASGTDEKNLLAVAEQHPLLARITTDILSYREAQKAIGTYYDFLRFKGRLLWSLDPFGTDTERMACKSSSLWCGTQIQNFPPYAKQMLIADDGYELFEADNSQSEGRTTAYCAQELNLIIALETAGRDFYKTLGTLFFNIPYEEVTDFFRNKVLKRIVHGTNYMMGAKTFIENIGIIILYETAPKVGIKIVDIAPKDSKTSMTLRQFAKHLLDIYHEPFPRIRQWYKEIQFEVANTGFLVSPLGHVRKCFGNIQRDHNMLRSLVAHQPQNLSVTILNIGFLRIYNELVLPDNGDIRLKAQIHDSNLGQIKLGTREHYAPLILEKMRNPRIIRGREMSIPVDIKFGPNWNEMEKWKPKGAKECIS